MQILDNPLVCCQAPGAGAIYAAGSRVRQKAWQVRHVSGLGFAYIGPDPAPEFPEYDLLFMELQDKLVQGRDMHTNWMQRAQNMLDALLVMVLDASIYPELAMTRPERCGWNETWSSAS